MDPIHPDLLIDIDAIRVAEKLGGWVSALDIGRIPAHWVGSARTLMEAERLMAADARNEPWPEPARDDDEDDE
jgi:hypothetical protein